MRRPMTLTEFPQNIGTVGIPVGICIRFPERTPAGLSEIPMGVSLAAATPALPPRARAVNRTEAASLRHKPFIRSLQGSGHRPGLTATFGGRARLELTESSLPAPNIDPLVPVNRVWRGKMVLLPSRRAGALRCGREPDHRRQRRAASGCFVLDAWRGLGVPASPSPCLPIWQGISV